jgi:L-histidine N-alpha-methyltransferase
MKSPKFVQLYRADHAAIRTELAEGLLAKSAHTSPKYLYDALGSRLFEAITELPEYYPTRVEASIFASHGADMAKALPAGATLIDLGAGNCNKAASLFDRFCPKRYVAVDISVDFLRNALACLQRQYPALDMVGVGMDFAAGLSLPPEAGTLEDSPRVLFYPGSSIGNFAPDEALQFLRSVHAACGNLPGSGLLIGVDLVKQADVLHAAYDDALGVTAAFNRNMLLHISRLLGADIRLAHWAHVGLYNPALSRIEMHLQATQNTTISWTGAERQFAQGERIHTENSYKWTVDSFAALLRKAGFAQALHWCDPDQQFAVMWARH